MEFFRIRRDIPFMKHALVFNVISAVTFLLAVFFLATRGLNLGVDFRGGTVIEIAYPHAADLGHVRAAIDIVAYVALRVEWRFAVSAIIANLHDVVIILGFFALFQWEFSLPVLAAVLAVLGYSVNESVVIADRIRENFRKMRKASVPEIINNGITSTLSRTIITHGCTLTMVLSIYFFGG